MFVSELRAEFAPRGLLLSAAVSPRCRALTPNLVNINNNCSKKIIDVGYSVARLARDLDWVAVMTYDYHGHWDKKTGHVAPFYGHPEDDFYYFNTVSRDSGLSDLSKIYISISIHD